MNIQEITVNTSTLSSDIQALRSALQNARKQLDDMFEQIHQLGGMWEGTAHDTLNAQFTNDYQYSKNLCSMVESLLECMESAKTQYNTCEDSVNGVVQSIRL